MRMSPRSLVAVLLTAATIMVSTIPMQASDPERVASAKATYSKSDLLRNLGGRTMILTTDSKEKVTFKVNVDEEGDVTKLTYSHNVTSRSAEAMTQYIKTAYNAIMSTDFEPAMKDGSPVADTVVIEFNIVG